MSKLIETQAEFQRLADERVEEARALLAVGKWGGAYYLAGYGVELALKSCIIKHLMATDAFQKGLLEGLLHPRSGGGLWSWPDWRQPSTRQGWLMPP